MWRRNKYRIINFLVIIGFIVLPYYLFQGKLYVGGDDTRLLYSYPLEYLRNVSFYSWSNFSSVGYNASIQPTIPFLIFLSFLELFVKSKIVLSYFAFSLPLILIFIFFQKLFGEIIEEKEKYKLEIMTGSLFFVMSPIIIINQLFIFLTTVWAVSLFFILFYYFLRFLKKPDYLILLKAVIWSLFLSISFFSVPWILGFLLPLFACLIVISVFYRKKTVLLFTKRFFIFFSLIVASQSFWLIGFVLSAINVDVNSPVGKVSHPGYIATFLPTINSTAIGNIFYPIFNLFQRQIAFNFDWKLKDVFLSFYDKALILNLLFVIVFFLGILNSSKFLKRNEKKIYLFFLLSFSIILFLFTVDIGPLKQLFLLLGHLPGFVMFRNFYDKFAPSFVFIYAALITFSLVIVRRKFLDKSRIVVGGLLFIVLLNFIPLKSTVNAALWTTKNIYKNIVFPNEYFEFMNFIRNNVNSTEIVLTTPFGISTYSAVKEEGTNNVFLGTSPVKIFSGINDFSGDQSYNFTREANDSYKLIISKNTKGYSDFLYSHNVNYVAVTKNLPKELLNAWVYDATVLRSMDENFIKEITDKKIFESKAHNYELYTTKFKNTLLKSDNLTFKKINQVKYLLAFNNVKSKQKLDFFDSYHNGWKLYLIPKNNTFNCQQYYKDVKSNAVECKSQFNWISVDELSYINKESIFDSSQKKVNEYSNQWMIDPTFIESHFSKDYYVKNPDGSISFNMVMYFKPQLHFYYGAIVSIVTLLSVISLITYKKFYK